MGQEIQSVCRYFSHHIKNSTAMITASVTLMSYSEVKNNSLMKEIVEAAFLLDLFDDGLNICSEYIVSGVDNSTIGDFPLDMSVEHFLSQCKNIAEERNININVDYINPVSIKTNVHYVKVITNLILYECILQTQKNLNVTVEGGRILILAEDIQIPMIWAVFDKILQELNISTVFGKSGCTLEFQL